MDSGDVATYCTIGVLGGVVGVAIAMIVAPLYYAAMLVIVSSLLIGGYVYYRDPNAFQNAITKITKKIESCRSKSVVTP
jgi:hypothetical protein